MKMWAIQCKAQNVILFLFIAITGIAQSSNIIKLGSITYERKINSSALIDKLLGNPLLKSDPILEKTLEDYKLKNANHIISDFRLVFTERESLYKISEGQLDNGSILSLDKISGLNLVYNNRNNGITISQKSYDGTQYTIKDSIRKIKWKITNEFREICGFRCRRANALMFDSIYVVAFYTDEIHASWGPESFSGLPGLILGVALPYESTTWFAKFVSIDIPNPAIKEVSQMAQKSFNLLIEEIKKNQLRSPLAQFYLKRFIL